MINCGNCAHIRIQAQRVGDTGRDRERERETHPAIDTYTYIYIYIYIDIQKETNKHRLNVHFRFDKLTCF